MQVDDAPDDEEVRETYNFAPGSFGAVYRADIPDHKTRSEPDTEALQEQDGNVPEQEKHDDKKDDYTSSVEHPKYKLQSMKWGLIPFWTKRQPDYGSMMRTINCRDDSLIENRGMWTTMKQRKRCLVICQGFYEWLKKGPGGKEKVPHFVRRKDGDLMCFAGLWDCVKYEGKMQPTLRACFFWDFASNLQLRLICAP
jgi:putative SOS response-associated peptidase YedK